MLLTAREQIIASACSDLFWRWMARPAEERVPLDRESANALMVTTICNRQIGWEAAQRIVPEMQKRAGYTDTLAMITELSPSMLEWVLFAEELGKSLHRFRYFADLIYGLGVVIRERYKGDARNLWADEPTYGQLLQRIKSIKGFGDKTATLLIRLLVLVHGVVLFDGYQGLLPSDDRHVRRVGARLGLWDEDATFSEIVEVSQRLCPCCAAEVDSLFVVGTDWCASTSPMCDGSHDEVCPLRHACSWVS